MNFLKTIILVSFFSCIQFVSASESSSTSPYLRELTTLEKNNLRDTMAQAHKVDNGKWHCPYCNHVAHRQNLTKHVKAHLQIKSYECPYCSYEASRSDHILTHIRAKHGASSSSSSSSTDEKHDP